MFNPAQQEQIKQMCLVAKREGNLIGIMQGVFTSISLIFTTLLVYSYIDERSEIAAKSGQAVTERINKIREDMTYFPIQPSEEIVVPE